MEGKDMNIEATVTEDWTEKFGNYCIAAFTKEQVIAFLAAAAFTILSVMIFL